MASGAPETMTVSLVVATFREKMQDGMRSGVYQDVGGHLIETRGDDGYGVFADSDGGESELSGSVGVGGCGPIGGLGAQHYHGVFHGTMLGVVNDAAN
jgi:hypothetical protein